MTTIKLTQKEAFLKYLQEMNIDMLDIILSDNCTYFGVIKTLFLEKLSYISNQYKLSNCNESFKIKKYKSRKNYYALLLPFMGICNKFIIEEKSSKIVRLYNNIVLKTKEDVECISQFEFFFGDDEKEDFRPNIDYLMALHNSDNAYKELVNDNIIILTNKDIRKWLDNHASLYNYVDENFLYFKLNNFRNLYFSLQFTLDQMRDSNEVNKALKSFPMSCSHLSIINWLNNYYNLYFYTTLYFSGFISEIDVYNKTMRFDFYPKIYLKGDDFLAIFLFNELHQRHSALMCKKHH